MNAATLTEALETLSTKRVAVADEPLFTKAYAKNRRWWVADPGLRFWLRYVEPRSGRHRPRPRRTSRSSPRTPQRSPTSDQAHPWWRSAPRAQWPMTDSRRCGPTTTCSRHGGRSSGLRR